MMRGDEIVQPWAGWVHALTYVDVTWETCTAAEPEQQQQLQQLEEEQ